jgi:hypothetical protein
MVIYAYSWDGHNMTQIGQIRDSPNRDNLYLAETDSDQQYFFDIPQAKAWLRSKGASRFRRWQKTPNKE